MHRFARLIALLATAYGAPHVMDFEGPSVNLTGLEASATVAEKNLALQGSNPRSGKQALALTVSIPKEGYVQWPLSREIPQDVFSRLLPRGSMSLNLHLNAPPSLSAFVQVVDGGGERFQKILTLKGGAWGAVDLALAEGSFPEKWGGDGNGKMDFPLKALYVGLRGSGQGELSLDDLSFPLADAPTAPTVISFEPAESWDLSALGEAVGQKILEKKASFSAGEKVAGSRSLCLSASLQAGGYVQFPLSKGFAPGLLASLGPDAALEFSMLQQGDLKCFTQVVDATGETFQVVWGGEGEGWKKIRLALIPSRFPDTWGGDKDRQITRPIREIRFGLRGMGSGSVFLDQVSFPGNRE